MKKTLQFLCLVILGSVPVFAQTAAGPQVVHMEKSAIHVPAQEVPAALKVIYSNLGTKTDPFNDSVGWLIDGPNSVQGLSSGLPEFVAMAFTPKADAHVTQVGVAVTYIGSGADQVNFSIYQDSGAGAPGTLLAGPVTITNLQGGGCCTLTVAGFTPVAVSAGTQYWVTADTPLTGTGSDFEGVWYWDVKNMGDFGNESSTYSWFLTPVDGVPAGEVLGTIP